MAGQAEGMTFPAPFRKQYLPLLPTPRSMPHPMLHENGSIESALLGDVGDPLNAVFHGVMYNESFCFVCLHSAPHANALEKPPNA